MKFHRWITLEFTKIDARRAQADKRQSLRIRQKSGGDFGPLQENVIVAGSRKGGFGARGRKPSRLVFN